MQQADVLVNDHPVENILDDQRRNDPQHLNHERREKEVRQYLLVGLQVADESDPWGASRSGSAEFVWGREQQAGAAPAALEFLHVHLAKTDCGVRHPYLVRGDAVHHHVVVSLPMDDERQIETPQRLEGALNATRGKAQHFACSRETIKCRALGRDIGKLAELAERHGDLVVLADHRQTRSAAIHFLRLLDPCKAAYHPLAELLFRVQVEHGRQRAPLLQLFLALQLALNKSDAVIQHFAQLWIAFEHEVYCLLRHD